MRTILFFIGLIPLFYVAVRESGAWKRLVDGINTRKEDLEINWKTLEKAEKELDECEKNRRS